MAKPNSIAGSIVEEAKQETVIKLDSSIPKPEMVQISKSDLAKLMERVTNLENGIKGEDILDQEKGMSVLVRLHEGLPVINITRVFPRMNEDRQEELFIQFETMGVDGTSASKEMKYLEFLKLDKVTSRVKSKRRDETKITQGYTERRHNDGHNMVRTGEKVPVRVFGTKDSFLVTLPNGNEVELNESAVN